MFNIEDLMSGDFSAYSKEAQQYMEEFSELLKEKIKDSLIEDKRKEILKNMTESNNDIMDILSEILEKGHKGYNNMSMRTLLNIYLENKSEEDFIALMESVGNELK